MRFYIVSDPRCLVGPSFKVSRGGSTEGTETEKVGNWPDEHIKELDLLC